MLIVCNFTVTSGACHSPRMLRSLDIADLEPFMNRFIMIPFLNRHSALRPVTRAPLCFKELPLVIHHLKLCTWKRNRMSHYVYSSFMLFISLRRLDTLLSFLPFPPMVSFRPPSPYRERFQIFLDFFTPPAPESPP